MSAPPVVPRRQRWQQKCGISGKMTDQRLAAVLLAGGVLMSGCAWFQIPGAHPSGSSHSPDPMGSSGSSASPGPSGSSGPCEQAPEWLVAAIQEGLAVRGATLSNMYVRAASGVSGGPPELQTDVFASAWWVAGRINGAGVRPEPAVWLTNRTSRVSEGEFFAVDAAAQRYSEWGRPSGEPIRGDGLEDVRACVGPIPES